MGLHLAGLEVVGVDIDPQPNYPFEFHQSDALTFPLEGFDFIWASPPCQAHTQMNARWRGKGTKADTHLDLIPQTRERLMSASTPWCMENVVGARKSMKAQLLLHGGMFGLGVHRPRLFEMSFMVLCGYYPKAKKAIGVYGDRPDGRRLSNDSPSLRAASSIEEARRAMGIDWMNWDEIREAIPPAYSRYIAEQWLSQQTHPTPMLLPPSGSSASG